MRINSTKPGSTARSGAKRHVTIWGVLCCSSFLLMLAVNFVTGLSADETYFGSAPWHYLAYVSIAVFTLCLIITGICLIQYLRQR